MDFLLGFFVGIIWIVLFTSLALFKFGKDFKEVENDNKR